MADAAVQQQDAGAAAQAQPDNGGGSIFGNFFGGIIRMIVIMTIFNTITGWLRGPPKDVSTGKVLPPHAPLWPMGQEFSFQAYLSTSNSTFASENSFWREKFIYFNSDERNLRKITLNLTATDAKLAPFYKHVVSNGSLFMHTVFTRRGVSADPDDANYNPLGVIHLKYQINRHFKIKKSKRRNLLAQTNETEVLAVDNEPDRYGNYWNQDLYIHMVDFHEVMPHGQIYPHIKDHLKLDHMNQSYYPVIYMNDFWTLRDHLSLVNETVEFLPLNVTFEPLSPWKWQFYLQMGVSMSMQQAIGSVSEGQEDEFKRLLLETNPYLLGVTLIVSLLHSLFDFLAFKNDIAHWREKKNMDGTSVKTIMLNCVFQFIILLYLFDNETNWLILISSAVGLGIEVWKLKKAVVFKRTDSFPFITFSDRSDYVSRTKEYDDVAMTYLFYAAIPLLLGYATYSVMYDTHKSWYSFIVGTAVGFIYTFGFIMMTPQLFINYKLKSVAHMPWRTFMYKALNTFIDDLFSFIVKMPTLHRLSCFRDDIIFFIYLYQRWAYPIDPKRSNEYGQVGEEENAAEGAKSEEATPAPVAENAENAAAAVEGEVKKPAEEEEKVVAPQQGEEAEKKVQEEVKPAEQEAKPQEANTVPEANSEKSAAAEQVEEAAEESKEKSAIRKRKTTKRAD